MALVRQKSYSPPFWLPTGHLQTIYPALFRKVTGVSYRRERIMTSDGDFLLLDWCSSMPGDMSPALAIISHGFEGDSHRPYIKGMVRMLTGSGIDCLAWNYRSCGGEMNSLPRFYHSGATDDLDEVVGHALKAGYRKLFLIGFSLGGNLTLKYLGENRRRPEEVSRAVCFSVPLDLQACSRHLDRLENRIYQQRFLNTLRRKVLEKGRRHPDQINVRLLSSISSVFTFDDLITAPLHGFRNAPDYYQQCSARHYLATIDIPTLIVNAENDPMIPVDSLPVDTVSALRHVDLHLTRSGGHCGFLDRSGKLYWSELQAREFLTKDL